MGDVTSGTLFYFEPNADRTGLNLVNDPLLSDLIADSDDEISAVTFGTGFTGISDIETSPDGNLYILTYDREAEGLGSLYRIMPRGTGSDSTLAPTVSVPPTTSTTPPVDDQGEVAAEEQSSEDGNLGGNGNEEDEDQQNEDENDGGNE